LVGSAGGFLVGVESDNFDVEKWEIMEFSVSCKVINKKDGFRSRITTVYGDADESRKQDFLDELDTFSVCTSTPCIWGGGGFQSCEISERQK
jgi:hypothetical protein